MSKEFKITMLTLLLFLPSLALFLGGGAIVIYSLLNGNDLGLAFIVVLFIGYVPGALGLGGLLLFQKALKKITTQAV